MNPVGICQVKGYVVEVDTLTPIRSQPLDVIDPHYDLTHR